jgi:hypothetical protein
VSVGFVDVGGLVDDHCLEVIVGFVDVGGLVDPHCVEEIVGFFDVGTYNHILRKLYATNTCDDESSIPKTRSTLLSILLQYDISSPII